MRVYELTREQLVELKEAYLCWHSDTISYGELAAADELVSDETVFEEYEATDFTDDDFICTQDKEETA